VSKWGVCVGGGVLAGRMAGVSDVMQQCSTVVQRRRCGVTSLRAGVCLVCPPECDRVVRCYASQEWGLLCITAALKVSAH